MNETEQLIKQILALGTIELIDAYWSGYTVKVGYYYPRDGGPTSSSHTSRTFDLNQALREALAAMPRLE